MAKIAKRVAKAREAFEEGDARRSERLGIGHQVHLRDRHAILGIEEPSHVDDLPHGELPGRTQGTVEHRLLLGTRQDMEDIAAGFRKVKENLAELKTHSQA